MVKRWHVWCGASLSPLLFAAGCALIVNCETDADCSEGQLCGVSSGLPGDSLTVGCTDSPGPRCTEDADCEARDPYVRCAPHPVIRDRVCQRPCLIDGDCPGGEICVSDTCRKGCRLDSDCSGGTVCGPTGTCVGCRLQSDCPSGLHCRDQTACVECYRDEHCGEGTVCSSDNVCSGCRDYEDCGFREQCKSGTCVPGCATNAECADGGLCNPATGRCASGCCTNADCAPGDACSGNDWCEPPCVTNADCEGPGVSTACAPSGTCEVECVYDSTCGPHKDCSESQTCVWQELCCYVEGGCYGPFDNGCGGSPNGVTVACNSICCFFAQTAASAGFTYAVSGRSSRQIPTELHVYGQDPDVAVRLDSRAPRAKPAHRISFSLRADELETYRVQVAYPAAFTFKGFTAAAGPNGEVATYALETPLSGLRFTLAFPVRALDENRAYADLDRDGSYSEGVDPLLIHEPAGAPTFTMVLPQGGDGRTVTRVGTIDGIVVATLDAGLLESPSSPGMYEIDVALTSVDPDTDDADDGAGDPPLVSSFSIPIVIATCGDLNGDDSITAADALAALRMAVGVVPLDVLSDVAPADSPDGKVTAADALLLLRASVGSAADPAVCGLLA